MIVMSDKDRKCNLWIISITDKMIGHIGQWKFSKI